MNDVAIAFDEYKSAMSRMSDEYAKAALSEDGPNPLLDAVGDFLLAQERVNAQARRGFEECDES